MKYKKIQKNKNGYFTKGYCCRNYKKFKEYILENNIFWNRRSKKYYNKFMNKKEYVEEYRKRIYKEQISKEENYEISKEENYEISKEDKIEILEEICNFYNVKVSLQYSYDILNAVIIGKTWYFWDSLWGCSPPLTNIEYICKQIEENFKDTPVDLYIKIHNKYTRNFF